MEQIKKPPILSEEQRANLAWQYPCLDLSFEDDYKTETEVILEAQRDADAEYYEGKLEEAEEECERKNEYLTEALKILKDEVRAEVLKEVGEHIVAQRIENQYLGTIGIISWDVIEALKSGTMPDEVNRNTAEDPEPGQE